jgi:hypothetical protein
MSVMTGSLKALPGKRMALSKAAATPLSDAFWLGPTVGAERNAPSHGASR